VDGVIGHKIVGASLAIGLGLTGLAACGTTTATTTSAPPSVASALKSTINQTGAQLTVTLKGRTSALSGSELTAAQKQAILASSLVLTVHAAKGTTLAHAGDGGSAALSLSEGGSQLAQLKVLGSTIYARLDTRKIASTYGLDAGAVARFRGTLQRYSSQVSALQALADGRWVSLDLGSIQPFAQAMGMTLPSVPQLASGLVASLFDALAQGTSTTTATGRDQITVSVGQLVKALGQAVASDPGLAKLSPQIGSIVQKLEQAVPANKTANVAVTVTGGTVSNLAVPLNQFDSAHHLKGPLSVNVAVAPAGPVTAPSGAVAVDLGQLMNIFGHSMGS
jgi:hypothetical protein